MKKMVLMEIEVVRGGCSTCEFPFCNPKFELVCPMGEGENVGNCFGEVHFVPKNYILPENCEDIIEKHAVFEGVGICRVNYAVSVSTEGSIRRIGDDAMCIFDGNFPRIMVRLLPSVGKHADGTYLVDRKNKIAWKYDLKE